MSNNAVCVYDFTIPQEKINVDELKLLLKELCKHWCFQLEKGEETGYLHYQGRMSLKVKTRLTTLINKFVQGAHLSQTSSQNQGNNFYACKEETRMEGPWKDTDEEIFIPRQVLKMKELYWWQHKVRLMAKEEDDRTIHMIIDKVGNRGKSSFVMFMRCVGEGRMIPFVNDFKDMMRMVMDMPTSNCYFLDMPRSLNKDRLQGLFAGIEMVKSGYAYDDRYKFQDKIFDSPQIFVFSNEVPDTKLLSADRWKFWTITAEFDLKELDDLAPLDDRLAALAVSN